MDAISDGLQIGNVTLIVEKNIIYDTSGNMVGKFFSEIASTLWKIRLIKALGILSNKTIIFQGNGDVNERARTELDGKEAGRINTDVEIGSSGDSVVLHRAARSIENEIDDD